MPERLASSIRDRIIRGDLVPGDLLPPEGDLIEELGVSRPTLREATRILEAERLITVRRGAKGGAVVLGPSAEMVAAHAGQLLQHQQTTVGEVSDTGALLASAAVARLATESDASRTADELGEIHGRIVASTDPADRAAHQQAFDDRVLAGSGRATLLFGRLVDHVLQLHAEATQTEAAAPAPGLDEDDHDDRIRLIEAIREHDEAAAARIWAEHVRTAHEPILSSRGRSRMLDVLA